MSEPKPIWECEEQRPLLNAGETAVLDILAEAWNQFLNLEELHPTDQQEFMAAIHQAQYIVMARPVMRMQSR